MASMEKDVRIVLLGKTGSGKSSTGNTILSRDEFPVSDSLVSVTTSCSSQQSVVNDNNIIIIDTPGLFGTSRTEDQQRDVIKKCMKMSAPGPHVFLLVIRLDVRITDEEKNTVKWIQENLGEDAVKYTIILFTHADVLKGKSLDEYVGKSKEVQALIDSCGGRYHLLNNEDVKNRSQVTQLLEKIEKMQEENGGKHYSSEMFKSAQKKIKWEHFSQTSLDVGKTTLSVIGGGVVMTGAAVVGASVLTAGAAVVGASVLTAGAAVVGASVLTAGAAAVAHVVAAAGVKQLIGGIITITTGAVGAAITAKYRRKKESDADSDAE